MSTNSASPVPGATSNLNPSTNIHQNVVPSEVGWQFVPQYYTFVNKHPNRLHCFYTKNSTFILGTEGEDGRPCHGQQEIHQKILSIGFQDCKVFIHSVDAQASANNGIIIQVIGEMSNRGEPWRKFVQTFFLAEQPNGYYVLNDIFRFLKEESVEDDDFVAAEEPQVELTPAAPPHVEPEPLVTSAPAPASEPVSAPAPVQELTREPTPEPEPAPAPVPIEVSKSQPNGVHHESKEPEPVLEPLREPVREPSPVALPPSSPIQKAPSPVPSTLAAHPPPAPAVEQQQTPPQQPPQPALLSAPKTWANLAAADSKKWGSAVAQESRGVTVEATPAPRPPSRSGSNTPATSGGQTGPRPGSGQKNIQANQYQQAINYNSPHVFVKGLTNPIKNEELENLLAQYGKIKLIDFARNNGCAFVEYDDVKSAQRALIASLSRGQGGDGGIFYKRQDGGEDMRIIVETKKERGERPPPRPRGGAPQQGGSRGGGGNFRGGRSSGGRGRGAPNTARAGGVV